MKHITFKSKHFYTIFLVLLLVSCINPNSYNISTESRKYIQEVLVLLKKKSLNKYKINWNEFEDNVFRMAKNSQKVEDTYPAINYAIYLLKDNHSYFTQAIQENEVNEEKPLPTLKDEKTPTDIGYIRIPFCIGDEFQTKQYIKSITDKIYKQNNPSVKGWIVDLRDNFGGNMWPMMAAISSFLDTGTQGYFFDAENKAEEWRFVNGKIYADTLMLEENKDNFSLFGKNKIAVLINNKTASSGEAMTVLFKGYDNAKIFGTPTFGVSTGCESFLLSDGSRINLATTVFADKNKTKYGKSITPDFFCKDSETLSTAIKWINN